MSEPTVVYHDVESQNLCLGYNNLPWQFAAVFGQRGKIIKEVDVIIDIGDSSKIGEDAKRITRFSEERYQRDKQCPEKVWKAIKRHLLNENTIWVGHNTLGFDIYLMRNLARHVGDDICFDDFIYRVRDTISMARASYLQSPMPSDPVDILAWQYKHLSNPIKEFKSSLGAVAKHYNINYDKDSAHDALYDVKVGYAIYNNLVYKNGK